MTQIDKVDSAEDFNLSYIQPYDCNDPANEQKPKSVVYQPIFRELTRLCRQAAGLLRAPLSESVYHNNITRALLQDLEGRLKEERKEKTYVLLTGDMKCGKTTLAISTLGVGSIARKGDGGSSCTWVTSRFMSEFPGQTAPFCARVFPFNATQRREIMQSYVSKYYRATKSEPDEDDDAASHSDNYNEVASILLACRSLFCDHDEFSSDAKAREFLDAAETEDDEGIVATLDCWATTLIESYLKGSDYVEVEDITADNLNWKLQPWMYHCEAMGLVPSMWPMTSVIDYGFSSMLTNEAIVLVDAPGRSDANTTRAANAARYERLCTHKVCVADIGRAEDQFSFREDLKNSCQTRGSGNVLAALTHADSIDEETEVTGTGEQMKQERTLAGQIRELKTKRAQLLQRARGLNRMDNLEIHDEIKAVAGNLKALMRISDALRLDMRNRKVCRNVQNIQRHDGRPTSPLSLSNWQ